MVNVYSVSGVEIGTYALEGFLQVDLAPGIYLVKSGNTVSKVIVY